MMQLRAGQGGQAADGAWSFRRLLWLLAERVHLLRLMLHILNGASASSGDTN